MLNDYLINEVAQKILSSRHVTVFSGAGISVESGIPPFRGENGIWTKFNPELFDINFFRAHPKETWKLLKDVFYDYFRKANPNPAHYAIARLEGLGFVKAVITQNIDYLHQRAGSKNVIEFHGTSQSVVCTKCNKKFPFEQKLLEHIPPVCEKCGTVLKPDFVFFGEGIPAKALRSSMQEIVIADIFLVVGTTGEIYPASAIPFQAKQNGATVIEINTQSSEFTSKITDFFLQGKAGETMTKLMKLID